MLNRDAWVFRAIAFLLIVSTFWTPMGLSILDARVTGLLLRLSMTTAYAEDAILSGADAGRAFGESQMGKFANPQMQGNTVTFPELNQSLDMSRMYPDAVSNGATGPELEDIYGDERAMQDAGTAAQERLANENSTDGMAYRVLVDTTQNLSRPDLTNDPIFSQTDEVNANIDLYTSGFADCSTDTTFEQGTINTHVPDYKYCDRNGLPIDDSCRAEQIVRSNETPISIRLGAYMVYTATFEVDLKAGTWVVTNPKTNEQYVGEVPQLDYDTVCPAGAPSEVKHTSSFDWTKAPVPGGFDSSSYYRVLEMPSCDNDLVGLFQIQDDSGNYWFKYGADFRLTFRSISEAYWDNPECAKAAATVDEFCANTEAEVITDGGLSGGCAVFDGFRICEGTEFADVLTEPAPGYSKWLSSVTIKGMTPDNCPFWKGQMECWTDTQGVEHCPEIEDFSATNCEKYEQDPACGYISTECTKGAESASGQCLSQTETWDCGYDQDVPTLESDTEYTCAGEIRCMGMECGTENSSTSKDFARAAAALQAAEAIRQDGSCEQAVDGGHHDVEDCKIFQGEAMECKTAVGGYVDCCETPDNVSMGDYLNLMFSAHKAMTTSMGSTGAVAGAWETLRTPYQTGWNHVTSAWDSVKGGFSSAWDSLTGSTQAATSEIGKKGAIAGFKQKFMEKTVQWTADAFGPQAANALFVSAGKAGAGPAVDAATGQVNAGGQLQLGGVAGNLLGGVMLAYTIYSMTKLLIQIIWACEPEEFELGAKRELKSCHYTGSYCASEVLGVCIEKRQSYCCFNSPLSRIIQEQARAQLGIGWGDEEDPDCRPLRTSQLDAIDWDRVNLDEWLGILSANGHWPNADNLNPADLTGAGSALNTGDREDVVTRTEGRIDGIDITDKRHEAANDIVTDLDDYAASDAPLTSENGGAKADWDEDGVPNATDNCTFTANASQIDRDRNGVGDDCE